MQKNPMVIIDGAHNPESFRNLRNTIRDYLPNKNIIFVFGVSEDKNVRSMLKIIKPVIKHLIITRSVHPRALETIKIQDIAESLGISSFCVDEVEQAKEKAESLRHEKSSSLLPEVFSLQAHLGKSIYKMFDSKNKFDQDEFTSALFERAEDLSQYENADPDSNGLVKLNAIDLEHSLVLPQMITPIFLSPGKDLESIIDAQNTKQTIIGLAKKSNGEYLSTAIELAAGKLIKLPDGNFSTLIQGRRRIKVISIEEDGPFLRVSGYPSQETISNNNRNIKALVKNARSLFEQFVQLDRTIPDEAHLYTLNITDPGELADTIATSISPEQDKRIRILELHNPEERLIYISKILAEELDVLTLEEEIQSRVQKEIDRSQREAYLREQVKTIQTELGESDIWDQEIEEYRKQLEKLKTSDSVKNVINNEIHRLSINPTFSPETGIIRNYIEWLLSLPWESSTSNEISIPQAQKILKKNHYGLKKAKERILEYLAVKKLNPLADQPILCFVGPPGTGKTSLGKSIAEALGREFVRVSLGGVKDEAEIRGSQAYLYRCHARPDHPIDKAGGSFKSCLHAG